MLFHCRSIVHDAGPTLKQHWFNACVYWECEGQVVLNFKKRVPTFRRDGKPITRGLVSSLCCAILSFAALLAAVQ